MTADVTDRETLINLQGDLCLVYKGGQLAHVLTFVHVIGIDSHSLRLVRRHKKNPHPDWPVSQRVLDAVEPAKANKEGAKWEVHVK